MDILAISGSTRSASLNTKLAHLIADQRPEDTVQVISDLHNVPFYDGDVEAAGAPEQVLALRERVAAADLIVFLTPEYNGTIPGVLGNAIDWLSRPYGQSVMIGKRVIVFSASPSQFGAVRAAAHLRTVLGNFGVQVGEKGVSVHTAHERLGEAEALKELAAEVADAISTATAPAPAA